MTIDSDSDLYDPWAERLVDMESYGGNFHYSTDKTVIFVQVDYIMHNILGFTTKGIKPQHIDRLTTLMRQLGWDGPKMTSFREHHYPNIVKEIAKAAFSKTASPERIST